MQQAWKQTIKPPEGEILQKKEEEMKLEAAFSKPVE
jgi:hypothetical protein